MPAFTTEAGSKPVLRRIRATNRSRTLHLP